MKTNHNSSLKNLLLFHLLKAQGTSKSNPEQGYILVIALGIVLALSGLMALYAKTLNKAEEETTTAVASSTTGFYAAESALNIRAAKLREKFLNYGTPQGTSPNKADACFTSDGNKGSGDFACEGTTIPSPDGKRSDTLVTTYVTEKNGGVPVEGTVPQGDAYQGLSMLEVGHSIYALSFKDDINNKSDGKQATAIIQMDVKSRLIPMFQFAAFYVGDLEIFPGAAMTLAGPVHTNGDLFIGSSVSLDIKGQVTTVKDIYARRKHAPTQTFDGAYISTQLPDTAPRLTTGSFLKNLIKFASDTGTKTQLPMNATKIAENWGNQIKVRTDAPVSIPEPSMLSKQGDYYQKADIRIEYKPVATSNANYLNTVPFEITAIDRKNSVETTLTQTDPRSKSLRQPIMVSKELASIDPTLHPDYHICKPTSLPTNAFWNSLSVTQKTDLAQRAQNYLIQQIQSQQKPIAFSSLSALSPTLLGATTPTNFNTQEWTYISSITSEQIAALTGRCFVPAPILEVGRDTSTDTTPFRYYNVREGQDMRLLQLNIKSLVIWNDQGVYLNGSTLSPTKELLYKQAPVDNNAVANSFQKLGLAAVDDTEGGMVIHATIDSNVYSKAKTNKSPYGFAFIDGKQLFGLAKTTTYPDPTGVTIASDQAIYVQGDYNSVRIDESQPENPDNNSNRQPASFLADSFNPLSNACINKDKAINHINEIGCNIDGLNKKATPTTFYAGILSGTDVSGAPGNYNGGLENYPRFAENWSTITWKYRGSFVSISIPLYVSGEWGPGYNPPNRDWGYDINFNDHKKLPPLTPQFVVLKQESFIRSFDQ